MVKTTLIDEVEKMRTMIDEMDSLSVKHKTQLTKQLDKVKKHCSAKQKVKREGVSQFEKPRTVDDAMADFAGWERGSMHSRVDITNAICAYIKANNLQKPKFQRFILLDQPLKDLLVDTDELKYPHIQKYIGKHFTD